MPIVHLGYTITTGCEWRHYTSHSGTRVFIFTYFL